MVLLPGKAVLLKDPPGAGQILVAALDDDAPFLLPFFLACSFPRRSIDAVLVQQDDNFLRVLLVQPTLEFVCNTTTQYDHQAQYNYRLDSS